MGYEVIEVNNQVQEHFNKAKHLIEHKIPTKFNNPQITKVWALKQGYHDWFYQIHLKTQDGSGNEHLFTVLFEVKGQHAGHVEVKDVHEGLKSLI